MFDFLIAQNPFTLLWYFFLIFLGAVIGTNLIALLLRRLLLWRIRRLTRRFGRL